MKVLFISYDGMSDPLGRSQVIPYMKALSEKSHSICILSCEKKSRLRERKYDLEKEFRSHNIRWEYCSYTKYPPILAKWWDIRRLKRKAITLQRENSFSLVHCRSYQSALIGMHLKKKFGVKFIFDMRGFYVDERMHQWGIRLTRLYLKHLEKLYLTNADAIISLTRSAMEEMKTWDYITPQIAERFVHITTCCDIDRFKETFSYRLERKFNPQSIRILYMGSIGLWHSFSRICEFIKFCHSGLPQAHFQMLINWDAGIFRKFAEDEKLDPARFSITYVDYKDIPFALREVDFGFFFGRPVLGAKAASPTKMGEMLSCGIPVVVGHSIGDMEELVTTNNIGAVVKKYDEEEYRRVTDYVLHLLETDRINLMQRCLAVANDYFSFQKGIEKYDALYKRL